MKDEQVLEYTFQWTAQAVLMNVKNSLTDP